MLKPPPSTLMAAEIIRLLDLKPHPEGGHFREVFRDARQVDGARAASTAIYFLLARGERSHWHRIDAAEIWHFHAGAALELLAEKMKHASATGATTIVTANPGCLLQLRAGAEIHATGQQVLHVIELLDLAMAP